MCGIVAEYGASDPAELERMLERIAHRGPDDRGSVQVNGSWLGHRRLSIVDVEGGAQPLRTAQADAFLVGNGEVYNHENVRSRLEGREILTTSDNEVALHLLDEFGPEALRRLNGMHAFDDDWQEHVEPFPPGYAWTPEDGLIHFASAVPEEIEPLPPGTDLHQGTREALVHAVERQMMGDVPVGVFLSGGLDSSLVAAIAARWAEREGTVLHTFAVGTEGSPDLVAARSVAQYLGTEHHETDYRAAEAL